MMEYRVSQLSKVAGVSVRTLHYYDRIGLLSPERKGGNGYRVYGQKEVELLQQILFYREMGLPLSEIRKIVRARDYDAIAALRSHLSELKAKREQIGRLIANVEKTIAAAKGETTMSDKERFEGFKRKIIDDNEKAYGKELREKYGEDAVEAGNAKIMGLTREQYAQAEELSRRINETLKEAFVTGDPAGESAQEACRMHKKWLGYYWGAYSKEAHLGLAQTYVDDPRFTKYFDENAAPGCAAFFLEAMKIFCG